MIKNRAPPVAARKIPHMQHPIHLDGSGLRRRKHFTCTSQTSLSSFCHAASASLSGNVGKTKRTRQTSKRTKWANKVPPRLIARSAKSPLGNLGKRFCSETLGKRLEGEHQCCADNMSAARATNGARSDSS